MNAITSDGGVFRHIFIGGAVGVTLGLSVVAPGPAWAGKLTCLTGTDPAVANDQAQISAVLGVVDAACPCANYDGSPGQTHAKYTACAGLSIDTEVGLGHLRSQCKATVKKYYSTSTCGVPASKGVVPCVKDTAAGKVSCAIKPQGKCVDKSGYRQLACVGFSNCRDASFAAYPWIIGESDLGYCKSFVDNGDGTLTDKQTGLTWEKKDDSGGVHDKDSTYTWAGRCSNVPTTLCQPDAASAAACSAATGGALGCALCGAGQGTCNVDPIGLGAGTTIWQWLLQLSGFAGHSDWRIPNVELLTILAQSIDGNSHIVCVTSPCVTRAFNTCRAGCTVTTCSCTAPEPYWSTYTDLQEAQRVDVANFNDGNLSSADRNSALYVRAVRGPGPLTPTPTPTRTPTPVDLCNNATISIECGPLDQCHVAGTCNPSTGLCSASLPKADGTRCDDGNPATLADKCTGGVCAGCVSSFVDNGDGTITDTCTKLMWEKKDWVTGSLNKFDQGWNWANTCSTGGECQPDARAENTCKAQTNGVGCEVFCAGGCIPTALSGNTIWAWLNALNDEHFGGHNDWRIPTSEELPTIVASPCPGGGQPCVRPAFNNNCMHGCTVTTCSCTRLDDYWSADSDTGNPAQAVGVNFRDGGFSFNFETAIGYVRAVRGGS